jgi:hypothetical protein
MEDIWRRALGNPTGIERDEIFNLLTTSKLPFDPRQRQYARDYLGPDTVTTPMKLASARNPQVLQLFQQLYPQDAFIKALYAGIR